MDWNDLKQYIGVENDDENTFVQECWTDAASLVDKFIGTFTIPTNVRDRAVLEVGNELYVRKNAPSGGSQFATFDGGTLPVRGPRDPMTQVYPILRRWVAPF